ncbi:MAG TPA: hypothetical protein VFN55_16875 [Solirubrobacteraceae bacterium]|nr:hypothetical protein [Solirubrobacteraceae bacterium]
MSTSAYPGPRPDRATAQRNRDAALARLARVRTVTIAGAGVLTAAVAGVVSSASGHTLGKRTVTTAAVTPRASTSSSRSGQTLPPLASARQLGLGRPGSAPGGDDGGASQPSASQPQATQPQATQPQATQPAPQTVAPQPAPAPAVSGGS